MKKLWYLEMQGITDAVTRRQVPDDPNHENESNSYYLWGEKLVYWIHLAQDKVVSGRKSQ